MQQLPDVSHLQVQHSPSAPDVGFLIGTSAGVGGSTPFASTSKASDGVVGELETAEVEMLSGPALNAGRVAMVKACSAASGPASPETASPPTAAASMNTMSKCTVAMATGRPRLVEKVTSGVRQGCVRAGCASYTSDTVAIAGWVAFRN